jgi:hypothetical protein
MVGITWAILYIHQDRAHLTRVSGRIVSVDSSQRPSFGRSIHFGTYSMMVQYRTSEGKEETTSLEKRTYGFPSTGDSITLLLNEYGGIEASPFPELWIVLVAGYAGLGWLIWFFIAFTRRALSSRW